jgi:hypothetical protein
MNAGYYSKGARLGLAALTGFLLLGSAAVAQQPSDSQTVEQLLKRLADLEARLKAVEGKNASAPRESPAPAPADTASANAPSLADQAEANAIMQQAESGSTSGHIFGKLSMVGYSDVGFGRPLEENLPPGGLPSAHQSFSLGDLNLFITSQLSPRVSFYTELLITSDFTNTWNAEVDRAVLQYKANDYFQVGIGRFNTALGYYTNGINRAKMFQTATGRPFIYTDEDAGGILPVHSVGITMTGKIPSGWAGLHWVGELSNGMSSMGTGTASVQSLYDENNRKAYNVGLFIKPEKLDGFQAGVSVYRDKLEPRGQTAIDQNIIGAYAVYVRPGFEFLNEAVILTDSPVTGGRNYQSLMGYTQISRRFGHMRPYVRLEYQNVPRLEPSFTGLGVRKSFEAGIRRDLGEYFALKLQFGRTFWNGVWAYDPQAQFAFTF